MVVSVEQPDDGPIAGPKQETHIFEPTVATSQSTNCYLDG